MDAKKPDRRTIKTRKALCAGLAELLTKKELHRITVQEIADKADVNRVTFLTWRTRDVYLLRCNTDIKSSQFTPDQTSRHEQTHRFLHTSYCHFTTRL